MPLSPECITVVHIRHDRRDGADDRIVELVHEHPHRGASLVYTSEAKLRTRLKALGIQVRGSGALLKQIATVPGTMEAAATGHPPGPADGTKGSDTTQPESDRPYAPAKPGVASY